MCGIVGYVGARNAVPILLSGLRKLEYRGYDSAGVAVAAGGERLTAVRAVGKIASLEARLQTEYPGLAAAPGIGHTRWATHGSPSEANAHPHLSACGRFAVVHNGIIENYIPLREKVQARGIAFASETDTEVLAHLIALAYRGDLREAVLAALDQVEGAYGIAVLSSLHPDQLVVARQGSPIVLGPCPSETLVSSDAAALVAHTNRVVYLDDGDVALLRAGDWDVCSLRRVPLARQPVAIDPDTARVEKGGYEHFMLKEIHEQPEALTNALRGRLLEKEGDVRLSGMRMTSREMARIERVVLAACGTSYYAGMVGAYAFEEIAGLPAQVEQAAEFRYRNPIIQPETCLLAVSQSGETADTLAAVREGLRRGATVMGLCNAVGSTIARETGRGVFLHAGPEIGVASTKAFTCQVAVLVMMAVAFGRGRRLPVAEARACVRALALLPELAARVLDKEPAIAALAEKYAGMEHCFYIGRGYLFPAALEGALKLKEISYIHAEGYHAAELKHGPIALLDEKTPVLAAALDLPDKSKTVGNIQECRARNAPVIGWVTEGDEAAAANCSDAISLPACPAFIAAVPVVMAEQLFAYHVARLRGCEIDQPRNLAKSVTVE